MRTAISFGVALIVAIALGAAWMTFRAARLAEKNLASLAMRRTRLETEIQKAGGRLTKAQHQQASAQVRRDASGKTSGSAAKAALSDEVLLSADPKLQTLYLRSQASQQRNNMAPFYHALGLSAEQIKKLDALNLQGAQQVADLKWTAQAQGLDMNGSDYRTLLREDKDQLETGARSILGDAGYQRLQELEREAPVSYVVGQLGAEMAPTATSLSAEQAAQLTQMLASASSNYQAGKMAVLPSVDWDTALARAQGVLSDAQLASLKEIVASYEQSQIYSKLAQITLRGN